MKSLLPLLLLIALATAAEKPILCRGNYHSEADAIKQLARIAATHNNLTQWNLRSDALR